MCHSMPVCGTWRGGVAGGEPQHLSEGLPELHEHLPVVSSWMERDVGRTELESTGWGEESEGKGEEKWWNSWRS